MGVAAAIRKSLLLQHVSESALDLRGTRSRARSVLTLDLYDRITLRLRPRIQRMIAEGFLRFDYRNVDLQVEGFENIPRGPVIYAMNHTDNFNYWPFQFALHRRFRRYTATWVKGKNYDGRISSAFMQVTNNIPLASRGYVISRDFVETMGRPPSNEEYRCLRDAVDNLSPIDGEVPLAITSQARDMLGRRFVPGQESYEQAVDAVFSAMMKGFVGMNRGCMDMGLDVLVFPQGTRSRRLSRGHIGIAQVALHLGATIVPVGCSGSDGIYPGRSVVSEAGKVVYRIGQPIPVSHWADIAPKDFAPFNREDEAQHRAAFEEVTDYVMQRINELVDEPYRFTEDGVSDGTSGVDRFV